MSFAMGGADLEVVLPAAAVQRRADWVEGALLKKRSCTRGGVRQECSETGADFSHVLVRPSSPDREVTSDRNLVRLFTEDPVRETDKIGDPYFLSTAPALLPGEWRGEDEIPSFT